MSVAGKEQVLRIIQPGESFNDVAVFDGGPNPASADCLEESEVGTLTIVDRGDAFQPSDIQQSRHAPGG